MIEKCVFFRVYVRFFYITHEDMREICTFGLLVCKITNSSKGILEIELQLLFIPLVHIDNIYLRNKKKKFYQKTIKGIFAMLDAKNN